MLDREEERKSIAKEEIYLLLSNFDRRTKSILAEEVALQITEIWQQERRERIRKLNIERKTEYLIALEEICWLLESFEPRSASMIAEEIADIVKIKSLERKKGKSNLRGTAARYKRWLIQKVKESAENRKEQERQSETVGGPDLPGETGP